MSLTTWLTKGPKTRSGNSGANDIIEEVTPFRSTPSTSCESSQLIEKDADTSPTTSSNCRSNEKSTSESYSEGPM